jgi:serine protease AprX
MNLGFRARVILGIGVIISSASVLARGAEPTAAALGGDPALEKCSARIGRLLTSSQPPATLLVWISFADRSCPGAGSERSAGVCRPPRAAARRLARARAAYDEHYLPVCADYVYTLGPHLLRLRHVSRYFNAVSAVVACSELPAICAYPFVVGVEEVAVAAWPLEPPPGDVGRSEAESRRAPAADGYGGSVYQLSQIGVTALLEKGYNGSGTASAGDAVRIGVLDTGFNREHAALSHVMVDAEWDFVQGDATTRNEAGDSVVQDNHGTMVLGVIGGYEQGELVGPAWGAHYLLAKTEIVNARDVRVEEDNWVAGIEWADTNGADIVTSSLAFSDWYTRSDLDGRTAKCTIAAGIAAAHGIIVVNSAGNSGPAYSTLVAPADGDSVFTIGAVDRFGTIASFSSRGPTADGRTKPDFVDMGVSSWTVSPWDPAAYTSASGTSFSAPLFAGGCALLLEMHPDWDPMKVRTELRASATNALAPDNTYGYGIPRFEVAAGCPVAPLPPGAFPNPFRAQTTLQFFFATPQTVTVRVYDCRGALVKTLVSDELRYCAWDVSWNGTNDAGATVAAGVYFAAVATSSARTTFKLIRIR